jgi:outer membrane protein OmpA-like peptidoglycan-associated protein
MKPLLFFSAACISVCSAADAQNLVVNPGFESYHAKRLVEDLNNSFSTNQVDGWYLPTAGTADFWVNGPGNNFSQGLLNALTGGIKAHEGNCFSGFYGNSDGYREYVGGSLSEPLEAGRKYIVSFQLSLGKNCAEGADGIGVYFSTEKKFDKKNTQKLPFVPQAVFSNTGSQKVSGVWRTYSTVFTATGGEKFFILGNFSSDKKNGATTISEEGLVNNFSYYFADDFSVSLFTGNLPVAGSLADIEPGTSFVARNILFDTDKATIRAESYPILYSILAAIKANPLMKVEVQGHTDATGGSEHNQKLSEARAKAIADFLVDNGIPAANVSYKGFGSSKPVSATDNSQNRRVEFLFM